MKTFNFLIACVTLLSLSTNAQSGLVRGTVIDADFQDPVPFANILVKETGTGTTSDFDGNYEIALDEAIKSKKTDKFTQSTKKNSFATGLTLSQEDALRAQIFGCWSVPLGLPYDKDLLVRIKLNLKKDGTIMKSEILDHQRMNKPDQKFYKVLAESALRAVRLCQPLKVPPTGYDKWKELQLNFNPTEMLKG